MVAPRHFVFLLLQLLSFATSLHGADPLFHVCGNTGNFTTNGTYEANLNTLLTSVVAGDGGNGYGFYKLSAGRSPDAVNAIVLCRGDVGAADCRSCLNDSAAEIPHRCPLQKEAVIWYDYCMLRYSNRSIFGTMEDSPAFYMWNLNNFTGNIDQFNQVQNGKVSFLRAYDRHLSFKETCMNKLLFLMEALHFVSFHESRGHAC